MSLRRRDPPSALVKTKNYLPRATDDLERQFEDFYLKLCAKLYAYARAFMSDHDAEDLVHTTITNLWERWPVLALENPTKALFFRAVHNAIVDVLRAKKSPERVRLISYDLAPESDLARVPAADASIMSEAFTRHVRKAVSQLPPQCKHAWMLRHDFECTYAEIADIMSLQKVTAIRHVGIGNSRVAEELRDAGYLEAAEKQRRLPPTTPPEKQS